MSMNIRASTHALLKKAIAFRETVFFSYANAIDDSFVDALKKALNRKGLSYNEESINSWFNKNQSILDNVLNSDGWYYNYRYNTIYTCIEITADNQDLYAWLTFDDQPPAHLGQKKKTAILQPYDNIPRMWLWIGMYSSKSSHYAKISNLSLELSHEEFVVNAICKLFYQSLNDDDSLRKITEFVKTNKPAINRLRSQFEFVPKYLGGGADGIAYAISNTVVLKLFRDNHAYAAAKNAVKRLHENPEIAKTEAMIYDVGVLGEYDGNPLYYYIIEKMKPVLSLSYNVQEDLKKIVGRFANLIIIEKDSKWRAVKKLINEPQYYAAINAKVSKSAIEMAANVRASLSHYVNDVEGELDEIKSTWLESLAEELLMKYLTSRTDLHLGNIGLTQYGEFRYYDPAYASCQSNINCNIY